MEEGRDSYYEPWNEHGVPGERSLRPPPPRVAVRPGARYEAPPPLNDDVGDLPAFNAELHSLPVDEAPAPLPLAPRDDKVERWALAAARGVNGLLSALRQGWQSFAAWTITVGARADVPRRVAALHLDQKARLAAERAAEASRIAAEKAGEASRIAAAHVAESSKIAAAHMAEGSKLAAGRLGEASKIAAAKTAELSKAAGDNIAEGVARLDLPEKLAGASEALKKGTGQLAEATLQGAETVLDKTRIGASELGATVGRAGAELAEKAAAPILDRGKPQLADAQNIPSELDRLLADEAAAKTDGGKRGRKVPPSLPLFADLPETDEP